MRTDSTGRDKIRIMGAPEGGKRKEAESMFKEIIAEKFPCLGKEPDV